MSVGRPVAIAGYGWTCTLNCTVANGDEYVAAERLGRPMSARGIARPNRASAALTILCSPNESGDGWFSALPIERVGLAPCVMAVPGEVGRFLIGVDRLLLSVCPGELTVLATPIAPIWSLSRLDDDSVVALHELGALWIRAGVIAGVLDFDDVPQSVSIRHGEIVVVYEGKRATFRFGE